MFMLHMVCECQWCKKQVEMDCPIDDYLKYLQGRSVQEAFTSFTAGQREMLISGTCEDCWDEMFPLEGEEPDEDMYDEEPMTDEDWERLEDYEADKRLMGLAGDMPRRFEN